MSYQIKIITDVIAEPVTLVEVKRFLRMDADYTSEDDVLTEFITSARERLELFLNVGFAERTLELQWNGHVLKLPFSPTGDIVSVKQGDDIITDDNYTVNGLVDKEIFINAAYGGCSFFYPRDGGYPLIDRVNFGESLYNVVYKTGYTDDLPTTLLSAIKMEVDYLYKNQGASDLLDISPAAFDKTKLYSKNLVIQ